MGRRYEALGADVRGVIRRIGWDRTAKLTGKTTRQVRNWESGAKVPHPRTRRILERLLRESSGRNK